MDSETIPELEAVVENVPDADSEIETADEAEQAAEEDKA
jgi:hypothetical protein